MAIVTPTIKRCHPEDEFYFAEGCYLIESSNGPEDAAVSIARARVAPGVTTRWHRLRGISERYVIVSGSGRAEIDDLPPALVHEGDVVLIPADCRQRIANIGADDLVFLAICAPPFRAAAYEDLEA